MTKKTKKFLNRKLEEWKGVTKREDVEEGFWQFCKDHAIKFEDNTYRVMFVMSGDKKDILRRIYARASGAYKIEKDENFYKAEQKLFNEFLLWKIKKDSFVEKQKTVSWYNMFINKLPCSLKTKRFKW